MDKRRIAVFVLLACVSTGHALAQARDFVRPPTAAEFQRSIPENADFHVASTVNGRDAVAQLRADHGLDSEALSGLARFNVQDPLNSRTSKIQATVQHAARASRSKVMANAQPDRVTAQASVGDTITETWSKDGWTHGAAYTWHGSKWKLTAFSAHKDAREPESGAQ